MKATCIAKIEKRLNSLDEKLVEDVIDQHDYKRIKNRYNSEKNELVSKISDMEISKRDFQRHIEHGLPFVRDLGINYDQSNTLQKQQIIGLIFPNKMIYDGKKYRTNKINEAIRLISLKINELEKGNKKPHQISSMQSNFAPHIVENSNQITEELAKIYDLRDVLPLPEFKPERNYMYG